MNPALERHILAAVRAEGGASLERLYTRHLTRTGKYALLDALADLEAQGKLIRESRAEPNGTTSRWWRNA